MVPLLVRERSTQLIRNVYNDDHDQLVWWATETECISALTRRERLRELSAHGLGVAIERLDALRSAWNEMEPASVIREIARRLLRTHDLRAGDALQLAAAITASESRPDSLEFVSLDQRLVAAADREGLLVVDI